MKNLSLTSKRDELKNKETIMKTVEKDVYLRDNRTGLVRRAFIEGQEVDEVVYKSVLADPNVNEYNMETGEVIGSKSEPTAREEATGGNSTDRDVVRYEKAENDNEQPAKDAIGIASADAEEPKGKKGRK